MTSRSFVVPFDDKLLVFCICILFLLQILAATNGCNHYLQLFPATLTNFCNYFLQLLAATNCCNRQTMRRCQYSSARFQNAKSRNPDAWV